MLQCTQNGRRKSIIYNCRHSYFAICKAHLEILKTPIFYHVHMVLVISVPSTELLWFKYIFPSKQSLPLNCFFPYDLNEHNFLPFILQVSHSLFPYFASKILSVLLPPAKLQGALNIAGLHSWIKCARLADCIWLMWNKDMLKTTPKEKEPKGKIEAE